MYRELRSAAVPILVIGYGQMGRAYVKTLLENGILASDLAVVDTEAERLVQAPRDVHTYPSVAAAFGGGFTPRTAFVLVNTPFHAETINGLLDRGVRNIFVEKPLTFRTSEIPDIRARLRTETKIAVAYLINFSPAIGEVARLMREEDLVLYEFRGNWGKDRTSDTRMSAGDLEDEMVHMQQLVFALVRAGAEEVSEVKLSATISWLPFVAGDAQKKAHTLDASVPLLPNSGAVMSMLVKIAGVERTLRCGLMSSFTTPSQTRTVDVVLGARDATDVRYLARLTFDEAGEDHLFIRAANGGKEAKTSTLSFPALNKVRDEIGSFLRWVSSGVRDSKSTTFDEGSLSVALSEAALRSDSQGQWERVPVQ